MPMPSSITFITACIESASTVTVIVPLSEYLMALSIKIISSCSILFLSPSINTCGASPAAYSSPSPFLAASGRILLHTLTATSVKSTLARASGVFSSSPRAKVNSASISLDIYFVSCCISRRTSCAKPLSLLSSSFCKLSTPRLSTVSGVRSSCEASAANSCSRANKISSGLMFLAAM